MQHECRRMLYMLAFGQCVFTHEDNMEKLPIDTINLILSNIAKEGKQYKKKETEKNVRLVCKEWFHLYDPYVDTMSLFQPITRSELWHYLMKPGAIRNLTVCVEVPDLAALLEEQYHPALALYNTTRKLVLSLSSNVALWHEIAKYFINLEELHMLLPDGNFRHILSEFALGNGHRALERMVLYNADMTNFCRFYPPVGLGCSKFLLQKLQHLELYGLSVDNYLPESIKTLRLMDCYLHSPNYVSCIRHPERIEWRLKDIGLLDSITVATWQRWGKTLKIYVDYALSIIDFPQMQHMEVLEELVLFRIMDVSGPRYLRVQLPKVSFVASLKKVYLSGVTLTPEDMKLLADVEDTNFQDIYVAQP